MAKNVHVPSLSQLSENPSMGDSSNNPITIFESSPINLGSNDDHLSFDNIDDDDKLSCSSSSSPPLSLSLSLSLSLTLAVPGESSIPNEQVQSQQSALIALGKRPMGRPLGSKNKPKLAMELPISTTLFLRKKEDFLEPIILIVPAGSDIINAITKFAHNHDATCISVLHASGLISEVNLVNPLCPSHDLTVRGNLDMFSLSGFYTNNLAPSVPEDVICSSFTVQISNGRPFQMFGGLVGSKLIAAESVQIMAFVIKKHNYHKVVYPISPPPPSDVREYMHQLRKFVQANSK